MALSLKTKNLPYLATFLLAQGALHLFVLGLITASSLTATAAPNWSISATATSLLMVVALVLSDVLGDDTKARLVFWRWRNPLPASAAFSRHMHEDDRIDPALVDQRHGPLPAEPKQQNRHWYNQIYKPNRDKPGIAQAHGRYLLLREVTAISAVLAPPLAASAFIFSSRDHTWTTAYAVGLALQYLVTSIAAANSGVRLVKNALAEASA